jgi:hypothetical protein
MMLNRSLQNEGIWNELLEEGMSLKKDAVGTVTKERGLDANIVPMKKDRR